MINTIIDILLALGLGLAIGGVGGGAIVVRLMLHIPIGDDRESPYLTALQVAIVAGFIGIGLLVVVPVAYAILSYFGLV